jgi:hypothetical protein
VHGKGGILIQLSLVAEICVCSMLGRASSADRIWKCCAVSMCLLHHGKVTLASDLAHELAATANQLRCKFWSLMSVRLAILELIAVYVHA